MANPTRLRRFVQAFTRLVSAHGDDEPRIFADGEPLLHELVAHDDWLPDAFAQPDPERYRQYLLWCDPLERFSVVSFVWGPGQQTPIHDHTVWGMVGVLRGVETCEEFSREPGTGRLVAGPRHPLPAGAIDRVSPRVGDIHRVSNALPDRPSVSIHVYGANIGAVRRHVYDPASGGTRPFVSGYSLAVLPNLWDRSAE
ncbi:MAG: cysteine dioxygenase [Gammaproteobacteria bacterium]|jgi:predicted metal-dependent enzyme (double-stranded beta helix superfamily)|nr:cysteine dioxygenase [Gammaproteobacteria bacterium]